MANINFLKTEQKLIAALFLFHVFLFYFKGFLQKIKRKKWLGSYSSKSSKFYVPRFFVDPQQKAFSKESSTTKKLFSSHPDVHVQAKQRQLKK